MAWILKASLVLAGLVSYPTQVQAQRRAVEVWMQGSDIETPEHNATKALRDSIEKAISRSSDMRLSEANEGFTRVTIPQDVIIARGGDVSYVLFLASISMERPGYTSEVSGYCKYDALGDCADKIVAALRAAPPPRK